MARMTAAASDTWTKPVKSAIKATAGGTDLDVPLEFVYSMQAPHLELADRNAST